MELDLAFLAVVALAVLRGWWRGLLAQLLGLGGLVAVWLLAPRLVGPVRAWLLAHGQEAGVRLELVSLGLAVGAVLGVSWLLATVVPDALRAWSRSAGQADRALGAALGAVRGVLFAALLLATMAWAERALTETVPQLRDPMRESHAIAAARTWNVWRLVDPDRLEDLRRALAARIARVEDASPLVLSILTDPGLQHAATLSDRRTLLADPRVVQALSTPDHDAELDAVLDQLDAEAPPAAR